MNWEGIIKVLILISSLLFVLTIHELGHFIFAIIFKVNVKEFSIGIGPKLFSRRTKKGLEISFRPILLAAYVAMDSSEMRKLYLEDQKGKNFDWASKPIPEGKFHIEQMNQLKSFIIYLGGILFNFISFLFFWGIFALISKNTLNPMASIGDLLKSIGRMLIFVQKDAGIASAVSGTYNSNGGPNYLEIFILYLTLINFSVGVLNILPIPPLDGSKVLLKFVQSWKFVKDKEKFINRTNIIFAIFAIWFIIAILFSEIRSLIGF
jgi:regulator of sigma E protease